MARNGRNAGGHGRVDREDDWGERRFRSPVVQFVYDFLTRHVWIPLEGLPWWKVGAYKVCRVAFLAVRGFFTDRCLFRASALTYITLLSLVPTLACVYALAKGFGAGEGLRERVDPLLSEYLGRYSEEDEAADLTTEEVAESVAESVEGEDADVVVAVVEADAELPADSELASDLEGAIHRLIDFVEQTDVSSLGTAGLLVLALAVIKLLGNIEASFNEIWGAQRSRSFVRKLTDYLAMLIVTPIFVVAATALSNAGNPEFQESSRVAAFLESAMPIEAVRTLLLDWAPLIVIWIGFTFLYLVLPNASVKFLSVALGGVVAGTLWLFVQALHVRFQLGVKNYNVIYAGFAFFPIFMVWINVSWAVVLFGAELAAAHQSEPAYRYLARAREMTPSLREVVALRAMARVVRAFLAGERPPTEFELAGAIGLPLRSTEEVLQELTAQGVLASTLRDGERVLLPGRDPSSIRVKDVLDVLRGGGTGSTLPIGDPLDDEIQRRLQNLAAAQERSADNRTLRQLALDSDPEGEQPIVDVRSRPALDPT